MDETLFLQTVSSKDSRISENTEILLLMTYQSLAEKYQLQRSQTEEQWQEVWGLSSVKGLKQIANKSVRSTQKPGVRTSCCSHGHEGTMVACQSFVNRSSDALKEKVQ